MNSNRDEIIATNVDNVYIKLDTPDYGIRRHLNEHFKFLVPNAKHDPRVKAGVWDGYIRLYNPNKRTIYAGILDDIKQFCADNEYHLIDQTRPTLFTVDDRLVVNRINAIEGKLPFKLYDYQIAAVTAAHTTSRALFLAATSSGKSVIIHSIINTILAPNQRALIVVPTVVLRNQFARQLCEYGMSADQIGTVDDNDKHFQPSARVIIATWKGIYKRQTQWFDNFDMLIGDEVHLFTANSLVELATKCNAFYRYGFTGTLSQSKTHEIVLRGLFGDIYPIVSSKELIDAGNATPPRITMIILNYSDDDKRLLQQAIAKRNKSKHSSYQIEVAWLLACTKRNKYIISLLKSIKGNTMVLSRFAEEHLQVLHQMYDDSENSMIVDYLSKEKKNLDLYFKNADNLKLFATYKLVGTGVNIPSINKMLFALPLKSSITVNQAIGRGMRLHEGKDVFEVYDIVDDLTTKHSNYSIKHALERVKIYEQQGFKYRIINVDLP